MQDGLSRTTEAPEAMLARLEASARRFETPCGDGTMAWHIWGEGEPLVLLHGGSGSWRHWARNVGPLSRAPHGGLPGHSRPRRQRPAAAGRQPRPGRRGDPRRDRPGARGGTRYDLCGFSFGALLSGHVAAQAGAELRSVTLVGAGALGLKRQVTELTRVRSLEGEARIAAHRHNLAALMFADPANIDALSLVIQEWNTRRARFQSRGFASSTSLRDSVAQARCPVALLYGERDAIAWPEVELRFEALRSVQPEAWTGVIPGAGHWVAYEAAETFNAMLLDMLRRRIGR